MRLGRLFFLAALMLVHTANTALANDEFEIAYTEYMKGFKACQQANYLRSSDPQYAMETFDYYLRQLDTAVSIYPGIMTTRERDMPSNLAYCQQVENNLKRAQAAPILEESFVFCDMAKESFDHNDTDQAMHHLDEYLRLKEHAYAISPTLDDIFTYSSRVKTCEQLRQQLDDLFAKKQHELEQVQTAIDQYNAFKQSCEKTLSFVNSQSFGVLKINEANKKLKQALALKKKAKDNSAAWSFQKNNPSHPLSLTLEQLTNSSKICEADVSSKIREAIKTRTNHKQILTDASNQLEGSLQECEQAKALSKNDDISKLDQAIEHYKASASLKREIIDKKTPIQYGKLYPNWPEGSRFRALMAATKKCQVTAAQQIKRLKRAARSQR